MQQGSRGLLVSLHHRDKISVEKCPISAVATTEELRQTEPGLGPLAPAAWTWEEIFGAPQIKIHGAEWWSSIALGRERILHFQND